MEWFIIGLHERARCYYYYFSHFGAHINLLHTNESNRQKIVC